MAEFKISRLRYNWRGLWQTATSYNLDDIVFYAGGSWSCIRAHTSTNFYAAQSFLENPGDTLPSPAWARMTYGFTYKGSWAASSPYIEGDIVSAGGNLYLCENDHLSSTYFNTNIADWSIFVAGNNWRTSWTPSTRYRVGDVVKYNSITYKCILEHTSASTNTGIAVGNNDGNDDSTAETWAVLVDNLEYSGEYATSTRYRINDLVEYGGSIFKCIVEHTSSATPNSIASANFTIYFQGFNFSNNWSSSTYYAQGDIVRQGGELYIANNNNQNSAPGATTTYPLGNPNWTVIVRASNFAGEYNANTDYKKGDIVKRGGSLWLSTVDQVSDGSSLDYLDTTNWELVLPNYGWRNSWTEGSAYTINDIVYYLGTVYYATVAHTATDNNFPGDNGSGYNYWSILVQGSNNVGLTTVGDLKTYNLNRTNVGDESSLGDTRVPIGNESQSLIIEDSEGSLGYKTWGATSRVFHVRTNGIDDDTDPGRGQNFWKPFKTIRYAAEKANDNFDGTTSIKVYTGLYEEVLPIIIPRNTAIIGEELRSATIIANQPIAALAGDATYTLHALTRLKLQMNDLILTNTVTVAPGNTETQVTAPPPPEDPLETPGSYAGTATEVALIQGLFDDIIDYIDFYVNDEGSAPTLAGSNTAVTTQAVLNSIDNLQANKNFLAAEAVAYIQNVYPAYSFDTTLCKRDVKAFIDAICYDLEYTGNYKSILAARYYRNAVLGSTGEDMFYLRDSSGLRNMTLKGLTGTLQSVIGSEPYQRPTGGAFVSLDPGWGPADTNVWIDNRSPYVQNCTTFGTNAVGQKIDGSLHDGGNRSIVSNDFTQVVSDGIGAWVLNGGRAELVSVFTYYAQIGMFAEDGGIIRATNGNSSYGVFGAVADGEDPEEVVKIAKVNTRNNEAIIYEAFAGEVNDYLLIMEFENAGQEYSTANYSIVGSGTGASVVQEEFRDNAIFEVFILSPGDDYILKGFNAQSGNTTTITLATNDTTTEAELLGCRLVITSGEGTGQYGYVQAYDELNKIATIYKESDGTIGWDHVIAGTTIKNLLTTGTRYKTEPRVTFSHPGFTASTHTAQSANNWIAGVYGETSASYPNLQTDNGDAYFDVVKSNRSYFVTIAAGGSGYVVGDQCNILGTVLGGVGIEHDLTITVTAVSSGSITAIEWEGVAISGRFVLTSNGNNVAGYSLDGENWYNTPLPSSGVWKALAAGENTFVSVAYGTSAAASSTDGINWTSRTMPSSAGWIGCAYGQGIFLAVSDTNDEVATSADGFTWVANTSLPDIGDSTKNYWRGVAYGAQKFVAIANSSNAVAVGTYNTGTGIVTWSGNVIEVQDSTKQDWVSITYGNGRFVAVSSTGYVTYSFDGLDWETSTQGMPSNFAGEYVWQQVSYGQGVFFAVGYSPSNTATDYCATSEDGLHWTEQTLANSEYWGVVCFGNPDVSLGDSVVSNNKPMWIVAPKGGTSTIINKVLTGCRAKGRAIVESGGISKLLIWDPGSGYSTEPTVSLTDPNSTETFTYRMRLADGVLGQPTFINRGNNYKTSTTTVTISGDGFADIIPLGKYITLDNLEVIPGPGAQFYVAGSNDYFTAVVVGIETSTFPDGTSRSTFQVTPEIEISHYILHDMEVIIREKYSQVRITGHDFLDVGAGNFIDANYPSLYTDYNFNTEPQNEAGQLNGGRVFYTSTDQDGNFRAGELFAVEQATGVVTISADFFDLAGLTELALGGVVVGGTGTVIREFSTDPAFTANSNNIVPTQRAIIAYLQSRLNIGGEDLLTSSFIAGTVRVGPNQINNTASLTVNFPVMVNFDGPNTGVSGSMLAQNMFFKSFT